MTAIRMKSAIALTIVMAAAATAVRPHSRGHGLRLDLEAARAVVAGGGVEVAEAAAAPPLVQRQSQVGEFAALEGVKAGAVVQGGYSILQIKKRCRE